MSNFVWILVILILTMSIAKKLPRDDPEKELEQDGKDRVKFEVLPKRLVQGEGKTWIKLYAAEENETHKLKFHLVQDKMAIMKALKEGKQLSKEEVTKLSLIPGVKEAVIEWLDQTKGVYITESTDFTITAESTFGVWNQFLKTEFFIWKENVDEVEPRVHRACESVSLPHGKLYDSIVKIDGSTDFPVTSFLRHPIRVDM